MGVHQLWNILEPVRRKENLSVLRNKTLCVDLSGWICEARCAKGLKQNVSKPHLRNLFFRLLYLTRLGVKLVFVVDGEPPELKWEAIAKRIQARNGGQNWRSKNSQKSGSGARVGRSHFAFWVRECCTLLNLFGIPCIESTGEAEALCAWLNLHQIVDGCITNDGDAFLYGARTVYKDLSISGKDASVECYKMEEIESQLNLNRQKLVALGILLGCDYLPQGVSGVGKEIAMKLIRNVNHDNLIERFYEWTNGTCQDKNLSSIEKSVKCKALKDKNFPHPKVIQEFMDPKVVPERVSLKIMSPDLQGLEEFCLKNLEWPEEYTREKVLLLITYWQMTSSLQQHTATLVQPERIVKARIQHKVECYEVKWQNVALGEKCPTSFVTIEARELFTQIYPDLVEEFNNAEAAKLCKKSRKKKPDRPGMTDGCENEMDLLSQQLEDLSVQQSHGPCHEKLADGDVCKDESLQDIIDSIPPTTREKSSLFARMDDGNRNCFATGGSDIDSDVDDDVIPCDFQPLDMEGMDANLNQKESLESDSDDDDDQGDNSLKCRLLKLKAVKLNPDLRQDVLDCSDDDDDDDDVAGRCRINDVDDVVVAGRCSINNGYDDYDENVAERCSINDDDDDVVAGRCSINDDDDDVVAGRCSINDNLKPLICDMSFGTKKPAETKPIPRLESLVVVDSSDDDDNDSYEEEPPLKQSVKASKAKQALPNDTDLNELFGSSDLWSSDDNEEGKHSLDHGESCFTRKPSSCKAKCKTVTHTAKLSYVLDSSSAKYLQKPIQDADPRISCNTDLNNSLNLGFEKNGGINVIDKGFLSSVLQDVSSVQLDTDACKGDLLCGQGAKRGREEQARTAKIVLSSTNTSSSNPYKPSAQKFSNDSQKTAQCNSAKDAKTQECSKKLQKQESWKENVDSPFDDYMPAPLFKRLGQNFSAKQRLASLRSISSAKYDI